jgi:hypothetical protein
MARLIRADARGRLANLTGEPADVQRALDDIHAARSMKPGNPTVLTLSLQLHCIAVEVFNWRKMEEEKQNVLRLAERDFRELAPVHTGPAIENKGRYWLARGDEASALREWTRHLEEVTVPHWAVSAWGIPALYRARDYSRALSFLEKNPFAFHTGLRSFILAELPDGPRLAYEAFKNSTPENEGWRAVSRVNALQLLGRVEEAQAAFLDLKGRFRRAERNQWWEHVLSFELGQSTDAQLLEAAGRDQWSLCEGNFYIAMKRLSEGDRIRAREHFQRSVDTPVLRFYEHQWSRCFLTRMDADPNWPPWITNRSKASLIE